MLSVLIPTYHYNVVSLVKEIHTQLQKTRIAFEIICLDDGSLSPINLKNEEINTLAFSSFEALKKNMGRSAIRNLLAKKATFDWLLFLDADVFPAKKSFIENYLKLTSNQQVVFCGGIQYKNTPENKKLLRYKFGKKHEEVPVYVRNKNPEKYFFTSNFLIQKDLFKLVSFQESLQQYGREDLLFSIHLVQNNILIKHVANAVFHLGLDTNATFVLKTKQAVENLIFLEKEQLIAKDEMPLLKFANTLVRLKIGKMIGKMTAFFERLAIKKSAVFYLHCLKVSYLCYLKTA